ncbi:hypothetical protein KIF24_08655 [Micromonospora sp. Llam7]|nr:hypothetical protein [Micromonospora tarapacensis]
MSTYTRSVSPRSMPMILPQPRRPEQPAVGPGASGAGRAQQAYPTGELDGDGTAGPADGGDRRGRGGCRPS